MASIKIKLDAITDHLQMVAALAGSGRLDISSPVDMRETLWVMMTQVPSISSAAFATFDLKMVRVARRPDGQVIRDTVSLADLPRGLERFRELQTSHVTFWGALFWNDVLQQPVLNVRTPIRRIDDAFIGGLLATVALGDLSLLIGEASQESGGRYFILVGRDRVLAHRRLVDPRGLGLSADRELPTIKEVDDPVLARIWSPPIRSPQIDRGLGDVGHVIEAEGRRWVFVYRKLLGYGPEPWLVGQYFPLEEATSDLDRLTNGAIVGGATLAVAALLALLIGLSMARSIRTITSAAESIERLEFDQPFHRSSRLREIDDAGHSLDKARGALKWFGAYVPHRLVFRLMELGEDAVRSRRRNVTVMFSDIVEFTPQAEDLPEAADRRSAEPSLRAARRLHRSRAGRDRQVHRRLRHGGVGWPVAHGGPCRPCGAGSTRHRPRDRRGQCRAPRRRRAADPGAHRAPFRPGGGRQYRRAGPRELHRGR